MGSVYRCCKPAGHAGEHSAFMPEAQDTFTPDEYEFEVWFGGRLWDSGIRSGESIVTTANERAAQAKAVALGPVEIKYFARADVTARLVGEQGEGTT